MNRRPDGAHSEASRRSAAWLDRFHPRWLACLALVTLAACSTTRVQPSNTHLFEANDQLFYLSDYVSFVGEDNNGRVAFALDTNRGRDGAKWKAEHFSVLHDETEGWQTVRGGGDYEDAEQNPRHLPDSPSFQFHGTPESGLTITSPVNDLTLRLDPIAKAIERWHRDASLWIGSAAAEMSWNGRVISGRVIYEYLSIPGFNRLTRTYPGLWKDFHGIYARIGSSESEGDLYWHTQKSPLLGPLVGNAIGFLVRDGQTTVLDELEVEVLSREQAVGFFGWPTAWSGRWQAPDEDLEVSFSINISERDTLSNWIVGGFAMGIAEGILQIGDDQVPIYGLAELLI